MNPQMAHNLLVQNLNKQRDQQLHEQLMLQSQQQQRAKLPFPTQRPPNGLIHPPLVAQGQNVNTVEGGNVTAGGSAAATANCILQNNIITALQQNMLKRNQLLSAAMHSTHAAAVSAAAGGANAAVSLNQMARNPMVNPFSTNQGNVLELCQLISLAKEKQNKKMAQNAAEFNQEQIRHYQQCALLERMKQTQLLNSQVHTGSEIGPAVI